MPHNFQPPSSVARSRQGQHRLNRCSTRQPVSGELHERAAQRSFSLASPRERVIALVGTFLWAGVWDALAVVFVAPILVVIIAIVVAVKS